MERSESIKALAMALAKFQSEIKQPQLNKEVSVKTKSGFTYKFRYSDFAEIKKSTASLLGKNGLAVIQLIENDGAVTTLLTHESGEYIGSTAMIAPSEPGAQAIGSAITYLKRYAYCSILGIVADADDDANVSSGNEASFTNKQTAKPTIFETITTAKTTAELAKIYNENPNMHTNPDFVKALSTKRKSIEVC